MHAGMEGGCQLLDCASGFVMMLKERLRRRAIVEDKSNILACTVADQGIMYLQLECNNRLRHYHDYLLLPGGGALVGKL